ncbi:hypothetical protein APA_896 [Pseudanabaena sp. lw0831]|nr:hypothetical protein APA_896 [Pseudanabaena sp. lw0831]
MFSRFIGTLKRLSKNKPHKGELSHENFQQEIFQIRQASE